MNGENSASGFPARRQTSHGLTKSWGIQRRFEGGYTGGHVQCVPRFSDTTDNTHAQIVASIRDEKLTLFDLNSGQIVRILGAPSASKKAVSGPESSQTGTFTQSEGNKDSILTDQPTGDIVDETVTSFAIHPQEPKAVTCSRNLMMRQWELKTGRCVGAWKLHHKSPVLCMDYDHTGTLVATGGSDRNVMVWDVEKGYPTHSFKGHTAIVHYLSFHPSQLILISASDDGQLRLWGLNEQRCLSVLSEHYSAVTSVLWIEEAGRMISAGRDKVINVWSLGNGEDTNLLKTFPVFESIECLLNLPSSGVAEISEMSQKQSTERNLVYFLTAGDKGQLKLWKHTQESVDLIQTCSLAELKENEEKGSETDKHTDQSSIATQFCELILLHGVKSSLPQITGFTKGHSIEVFNLEISGETGYPIRVTHDKSVAGHLDDVIEAKYLSRQNQSGEFNEAPRVALATNSERWQLMDLDTLGTKVYSGHTDMVLSLDVSPCGGFVATGSKDTTARIWDITKDQCIATLKGHTESIGAICLPYRKHTFSAAGSPFLFTGSKDKTIKKWNLTSLFHESKVGCHSTGTIKAHEKDINCIAVSPNDKMVGTASQDKTIKLWSSDSLNELGTLKGHKRGVWSIKFSPVDRVLASASGDCTLRLWNVTDLQCLRTFQGHNSGVLQLSFLSGGLQIMSGGADGLLKLWNIHDSECVNTWEAHDGKLWALDVRQRLADSTPGEGEMVTGGADGVLSMWRDVTAEKVEEEILVKEKATEKQQELYNSMLMRKYNKSVQLCIELDQPGRLRDILAELLEIGPTMSKLDRPNDITSANLVGNKAQMEWQRAMQHEFRAMQQEDAGMSHGKDDPLKFEGLGLGPEEGRQKIAEAISSLSNESLDQLLRWIRDWNTRARFSLVAQNVLQVVLKRVRYQRLRRCSEFKSTIAAMLPYTQRHLERLDRLLQSAYLVNYTVHGMRALGAEIESHNPSETSKDNIPITIANDDSGKPPYESSESSDDYSEEDSDSTEANDTEQQNDADDSSFKQDPRSRNVRSQALHQHDGATSKNGPTANGTSSSDIQHQTRSKRRRSTQASSKTSTGSSPPKTRNRKKK